MGSVTRLSVPGLALPLSPRWQEGATSGVDGVALAVPATWPADSGFAPTLTLLSQPLTDASSIRGLATSAMAAAMDIGYLVSNELWITAHGLEGRETTFGYVFEGVGVVATQWLLVHDENAFTLTLTAPGWAWVPWVGDVLEGLGGLELLEHDPARVPVQATDLPEPAHDQELAALGEQLEDLSRVRQAQPPTRTGLTLPPESLGALAAVARAEPVEATDPAVAALVAAGVLDDSLSPTEDGRRLLEALTSTELHVRCETSSEGRGASMDAWVVGGQATLLIAGEEPAPGDEPVVRLDRVPAGAVPIELARWLGIGPLWTRDLSPRTVPQPVVMARIDDPATALPAGVDDAMRALWTEPWLLWTAQRQDEHSSQSSIGVTVGNRAVLAPEAAGEDFTLHPVQPSIAFWRLAALLG